MALAKVTITIEHTGERFEVPFNPEEYTLNKDNNFASQAIPGRSAPLIQFVAGNLRTLEMELFFDTYDTPNPAKLDVRDEVRQLTRLLDIDPALHAPPVLRVSWSSLDFLCVLASANQKYVLFTDDGTPVRARVTAKFNEFVDLTRESREVPRQTADYTKLHVVARGQTLSSIAAERYGDARQWRPIAIANGIDDPRSLTPGQSLVVPSLPFIDPETGEVA
jgi:LysM repeat protein